MSSLSWTKHQLMTLNFTYQKGNKLGGGFSHEKHTTEIRQHEEGNRRPIMADVHGLKGRNTF